MNDSGTVFVCEVCGTIIEEDVNGPNVVRLQRFSPAGPVMGNEPEQWLSETPQHFHRRHAPALGQTWRVPED